MAHGHHHPHGAHRHHGHGTMHSPRAYDALSAPLALGDEARTHGRMLDLARVVPGDRVLDVGCGTGTLAIAAARRGAAVQAIDASPEMIEFARKKAHSEDVAVSFELAPAQALPFADEGFDVVLCSLALHHVGAEERSTAVREMRRVLAPKGRLLVVEIGRPSGLRAWLNVRALLHALRAPKILDEVEPLLRAAGFADVTRGALGFGSLGYVRATR